MLNNVWKVVTLFKLLELIHDFKNSSNFSIEIILHFSKMCDII
jgi:hypothetical protein